MIKGQTTRLLLLHLVLLLGSPIWSMGYAGFQVPTDSVPSDSLPPAQVEKVMVDSAELVITSDTIPGDTPSVQADPQPRIIYYQSDRNDEYKSSNVRYKERGGRRVKTLAGTMNHSGGFGALSFKSSRFNREALVMAGVRGGWIVNRTLAIGAEGYGIIPTAKIDGIVTDAQVLALGGYGGMFLELIFFSNEVVHVTFPVGGGAGWIGYDVVNDGNSSVRPEEDGLVDEDVFWYIEPGGNVELNVARNFRLAIGASKRFTQDLEILNTNSDALDRWNFFVTLKIGSF
ncbi:MAG: hypothetical protein AAGA85_20445 [Bacteroidota bacterium]